MSDIEQRLREAMDGVTRGEWSVDGFNLAGVIARPPGETHVTGWRRLAICVDDNPNWRKDAAYIALCSPDNIGALLDTIASLRSKMEEAEGALEPFAKAADAYDGLPPPKYFGDTDFETHYPDSTKAPVKVGDLRTARRALQAVGPEPAAFIPNPDSKPNINHLDCDPSNNHASNLEWCTQEENLAYMRHMGRQRGPTGQRPPVAKLSDSQVRQIRAEYALGGSSHQSIATKFRVSKRSIGRILAGKAYADVL